MLDCCIVFLHHQNTWTAELHRRLLQELNPYPVVSVYRGAGRSLSGAIQLCRLAPERLTEDAWASADAALVVWFRNRGFNAHRYVFLEWDALATAPVSDYYHEVWDCDVAATNVLKPDTDASWHWFNQIDKLPPELRGDAAGLMPFNGLLLSHRALTALAEATLPLNVNCELRTGTILNAHGFLLSQMPDHRRATNSWHPDLRRCSFGEPGIYHPVKESVLTSDDLAGGISAALGRLKAMPVASSSRKGDS